MREPRIIRLPVARLLVATLMAFGLSFAGVASAATDANTAQRQGQDAGYALVQLNDEPLATYTKTKPAQGKKIDFKSDTVKSYRAQLSALRNDYKAWLQANVPQARITGQFDISLNAVAVQLNGASLEQVAASSLVKGAQYQGLYYPNPASTDPDLALIEAPTAWAVGGGHANAGEGVKVAIVDTGIDVSHPCFSDVGYDTQTRLGDNNFTNNKVIVAKVFNNKTPSRHYTAEAIQDHGTHVAGTVACNYNTTASVNGVTIPYGMSGVAPRALLGNYNIFPGDVENARSEDILNALDAAYEDGFDIANMSLGGGAHGIQDLLTMGVDNLDRANMVVAVAAGNSGPGHFTVESPGSAERALTAGASSVPHFVGALVTVNAKTYKAATGDFNVVGTDLTKALSPVFGSQGVLSLACSPLTANLADKIALVSRGSCSFSTKIRNAAAAGAVAVLVANNVAGDPSAMASDGTPGQPTVPAYMVSVSDGQTLKNVPAVNSTTIRATLAYFPTANADIMAGFSSQGPTDVDFRVKPDVVAPGVNVLSSIPRSFCEGDPCFAFFQGTSMATPHLAGSAAFLRGLHPDWSAAEIRSAVVNTANRTVLKNYKTAVQETDANVIGAGREDLLLAANATVALDPVSVSFGAVPSGSGQTKTFTLTLTNIGVGVQTFGVAVETGGSGVTFSVSPVSLSLAAGASGAVTVSMSAQKGAKLGDHQAKLSVSSGAAEIAHSVVYALIK